MAFFSHPLVRFQKRSQINNFNWNRLLFPTNGSHAPCPAGCLLCWMTVRTWVKWSPALAGGHRLPGPRGSWRRVLAAPLWAVRFRTFPVEMPLVVCTRPKHQAGERNGKGTASRYINLTALSHCLDRELPTASFCSQHLLSFAPISSGHVLPLAAGDGGTSYLRVAELTLKPQNIALWALFFSA